MLFLLPVHIQTLIRGIEKSPVVGHPFRMLRCQLVAVFLVRAIFTGRVSGRHIKKSNGHIIPTKRHRQNNNETRFYARNSDRTKTEYFPTRFTKNYNLSETTSIADFKLEVHRVAIVSKIPKEAKGFKSQLLFSSESHYPPSFFLRNQATHRIPTALVGRYKN